MGIKIKITGSCAFGALGGVPAVLYVGNIMTFLPEPANLYMTIALGIVGLGGIGVSAKKG